MNQTTELLTNEIYPRLFENLQSALPEFDFKRLPGKGYVSTNEVKITGEAGKKGKVYCYEDNISRLFDYTRAKVTIWDYVKNRDGLSQAETLKRLAELAEYTLSNDSLSAESIESIAKANHRAQIWEDANSFFIHCLNHKENAFSETQGANQIRNYLVNDRGYKPHLFLAPYARQDQANPKIEVGYVPSIRDLLLHLTNEIGYPVAEVQDLITDTRIGDSHRLAIPYRDPSGRIRGMVFRTTTGAEPKYLYSAGLEKKTILFNLKAVTGTKDLVIVEGVLDALHATATGMANVVAIGGAGSALTKEHIEAAIKYGAKKITLILDNDKAGYVGTDQALALLQTFPKIRPYLAFVDSEYKDLDKLLTIEGGIDRANQIISEALPAWEYQLNRIVERYAEIQEQNTDGILTAKDVDAMLHDIVITAAKYSSLDAEQFINSFTRDEAIQSMGITSESLTAIAKEIREGEAKENRIKSTKELLTEAQGYLGKGLDSKALEVLQIRSKAIKQTDKANQFEILTRPVTEAEVIARVKQKPNDLQTGYTIEDEELMLPAGAISIIAAPTSHGKTTMLINLALEVVKRNPTKSVYLLSYEEDADSVLISAMNTYMAADLSTNNRKSIRSFFRNESNEYVKNSAKSTFEAGKSKFFRELISTGRLSIQYVEYDSETLSEAIHHLYKYGNACAVFIDYIQLIKKEGKFGDRQKEMKGICEDLKNVAVETGLPLILAAQFNRMVINAARMHPTYIGEAGDIERIANVILGFWNKHFEPFAGKEEVEAINNFNIISERDAYLVKLLKNRGGRVGLTGAFMFDGKTGVITNYPVFSGTSFEPTYSSTSKSSSII